MNKKKIKYILIGMVIISLFMTYNSYIEYRVYTLNNQAYQLGIQPKQFIEGQSNKEKINILKDIIELENDRLDGVINKLNSITSDTYDSQPIVKDEISNVKQYDKLKAELHSETLENKKLEGQCFNSLDDAREFVDKQDNLFELGLGEIINYNNYYDTKITNYYIDACSSDSGNFEVYWTDDQNNIYNGGEYK